MSSPAGASSPLSSDAAPSSTVGKARLGRIAKMATVTCASSWLWALARRSAIAGHNDALRLWASGVLERETVKYKFKLTAVAVANKVARIVFVLMT